MTRHDTIWRLLAVVGLVGCTALAGTALAVAGITGGGAGSQGDLGGAPAADPGTVVSGNTTANHLFTFTAENISKDGNTDTIRVVFPNEIANETLSVNTASVENASDGSGISISSSPSLVDGPDGDGVADTVRLAVSPTGGNAVDANVQVDVTTGAPTVESEQTYDIVANVTDSDGSTAQGQFATLTVEPAGGSTTTTTQSESTQTATPTATQTDTPADSGGDTQTATPTATQTDTPADSGGDTQTDSPTETDAQDNQMGTRTMETTTAGDVETTESMSTDEDMETTQPPESTEMGTDSPTDGSSGSGPGFTAVLAVLAVLGTALVVARRD